MGNKQQPSAVTLSILCEDLPDRSNRFPWTMPKSKRCGGAQSRGRSSRLADRSDGPRSRRSSLRGTTVVPQPLSRPPAQVSPRHRLPSEEARRSPQAEPHHTPLSCTGVSVASMSLEQLLEAVGERVRQELQSQPTSVPQLPPVPEGEFLPVVVVVNFRINTSKSIECSCVLLACIFVCLKSFLVSACFQYAWNQT